MKNHIKQILYFISLLVVINLASAITLEELIASYDFNYNDDVVTIDSITHYGNDINSNGLFDYLIIQINTTNLEANYDFIGDLLFNNKIKASSNNATLLLYGKNTINLVYNPKQLTTGNYNLSLVVNEDYFTHYRNLNKYSFYFDSSMYEQPDITAQINTHSFIDTDSDSKYEALRITAAITVPNDNTYTIRAYIKDDANLVYSNKNYTLTSGNNLINIDFSSNDITTKRLKYAYIYKIVVENTDINYEFTFNYNITYDFNSFDPEKTIFTGYFNDSRIDLNANNLSEYFNLKVGVNAKTAGNYEISLILLDGNDEFYDTLTETYALSAENNLVDIKLNGTRFYAKKIDAPLKISSITLKDTNILDSLSNPYESSYFEYSDFEPPPMPDLTFTSFSSADNQIHATISNQGAAPAYGTLLSIFDQNFTQLTEIITDLNKSQSYSLSLNTNNISIIYAFIDYNNYIEETNESNNFYMLELQGTNIINIYLIQGWNLISIPVVLDNKTIPAPFASIQGNYTSIFTYDAKTRQWHSYNPTAPIFLNTLSSVNETQGIWINMQQSDILELEGTLPSSSTFWLYEGWNLIGYPSATIQDIKYALSNVNTTFSTVYKYDAFDVDSWKMYGLTVPSFLIDLYTISPGYGYWIKMLQNTTWVFDERFN